MVATIIVLSRVRTLPILCVIVGNPECAHLVRTGATVPTKASPEEQLLITIATGTPFPNIAGSAQTIEGALAYPCRQETTIILWRLADSMTLSSYKLARRQTVARNYGSRIELHSAAVSLATKWK